MEDIIKPTINEESEPVDTTPVIDSSAKNSIANTMETTEENNSHQETNKPEDKEERDQKDILDILVEQTNISNLAENQENNVDIFIKNQEAKDIYININSQKFNEGGDLSFSCFQDKQYRERISIANLSYLSYQLKVQQEMYLKTRISVINNNLPDQELAMAAIEMLLQQDNAFNQANIYSFDMGTEDISISKLINYYKLYNKKTRLRTASAKGVIIIYCSNLFSFGSSDLLRPVMNIGGIADTVTNTLATENLQFICLCSDMNLYKTSIRERVHFALLHISRMHVNAFEAIVEKEMFLKLIPLMEKAFSEYGWLSKLNDQEQEDRIVLLIVSGNLELELDKVITDIDLEERELLSELVKDPLLSAVLFIGAFFEGISISEFDIVIRALLWKMQDVKTTENIFAASWEANADVALQKCGIALQDIAEGVMGLQFESRLRQRSTVKYFLDNYLLQIFRSIDTIAELLLKGESECSPFFLKKYVELIFIAPNAMQEKKLISFCMCMVDQLNNTSLTEKQLKILFQRLLFTTKRWGENEHLNSLLSQFYKKMTETVFRRSILGAILTHICTPEKPENITVFKSLLNSISNQEYFIKVRVPRIITSNYINNMPLLKASVNEWAASELSKEQPRSFSFFKASLLLLFYEKRFNSKDENGLDYRLIRLSIENPDELYFNFLVEFILANNSVEMFTAIFEKDANDKSLDNRLLKQVNVEILYIVYAYILVRCGYLLELAHIDKGNRTYQDITDKMKEVLLLLRSAISMIQLKAALLKSIRKYNILISLQNEHPERKKRQKAVYRSMRDMARLLITLSEQIK